MHTNAAIPNLRHLVEHLQHFGSAWHAAGPGHIRGHRVPYGLRNGQAVDRLIREELLEVIRPGEACSCYDGGTRLLPECE